MIKSSFTLTLAICLMVTSVSLGQVSPRDQKVQTFPLEITKTPKKGIKPKIMSLVVSVKGKISKLFTDEETIPLVPGRLIPAKGMFIVPKTSQVIFRPMPGITTAVGEDSKMQVKSLDIIKRGDKILKRSAMLYLNEGSVFSSIQKLKSKTTRYEIQTPQAIASAKGTRFWVVYNKDANKGKVVVVNGVVSVKLLSANASKKEGKDVKEGGAITQTQEKGGGNGERGRSEDGDDGRTIELRQGEALDMSGIGPTLSEGDIRPMSETEIQESDAVSEAIAKVEGVTPASINPFLTTTEATKSMGQDPFEGGSITQTEEIIRPGDQPEDTAISTNPGNTSTNTTVSPVGP